MTEIRGPQAGSYRQWIELYNASGEEVALGGVALVLTRQDGDPLGRLVVRDPDLVVAPGAYVVLGGGDPQLEDYIDYDYTPDWYSTRDVLPTDMPDGEPDDADMDGEIDQHVKDVPNGVFIDVFACEVLVDSVLLRALPTTGTLFWPGAPDAAANDDGVTAADGGGWCVDDATVSSGMGIYGTPREVNPTCS